MGSNWEKMPARQTATRRRLGLKPSATRLQAISFPGVGETDPAGSNHEPEYVRTKSWKRTFLGISRWREQVDQELAEMIGPDTVEIVLALAPRLDEAGDPQQRQVMADRGWLWPSR